MMASDLPVRPQSFKYKTLRRELDLSALASKVELCSDNPTWAASSHSKHSVCMWVQKQTWVMKKNQKIAQKTTTPFWSCDSTPASPYWSCSCWRRCSHAWQLRKIRSCRTMQSDPERILHELNIFRTCDWRDLHHHWSGHLRYLRVSEVHFSKHPLTIHSRGNSSCVLATWGWLSVDDSSPKSKFQKGNKLAYSSHFMDLYPMTFNCSIMCSTGSASFFLQEEVYAATMLISVSSSLRIHSEAI